MAHQTGGTLYQRDGIIMADLYAELKQPGLRLLDGKKPPRRTGADTGQVTIEGPENTEDAIEWADLLLITGTTLANGTVQRFVGRKALLFYGTTIAGAAHLKGWQRFCACAR